MGLGHGRDLPLVGVAVITFLYGLFLGYCIARATHVCKRARWVPPAADAPPDRSWCCGAPIGTHAPDCNGGF